MTTDQKVYSKKKKKREQPCEGWIRKVTFQQQMLSLNSGYWESDAADVINQTESVNPVLFWAQHSWVVPGEVEETTRSGGGGGF